MRVKIVKLIDAEKLKAYATASFDEKFLITGIKVIDSVNGLFVAMPSRRKKSGEFADICFPITREMREQISADVLEAYKAEIEEGSQKQE
ncbi:MAG: SpoVG family protein [Clostridia bacterium]|nr:SpoVG family protein [Clostridia bacterium]